MGSVKTSQIEPNNGVDLNLISGPGGYVYVNGQIITGSGSVIIGPQGDMGPTGSIGDTGATGATGPKGDTGEQGIPGIDGAVLPAGLTWSGTWSGTQSYLKNYVVGYASASWWSKNNIEGKPFPLTPNSPPDIDYNNWALLATQGPVGPIGPIGPQGLTGPTGIGLQGIQGIQGPTGIGLQGIQGIQGIQGPTGATGGIMEAPTDGNQYVRKDGDWLEVQVSSPNLQIVTDQGNITSQEVVSSGHLGGGRYAETKISSFNGLVVKTNGQFLHDAPEGNIKSDDLTTDRTYQLPDSPGTLKVQNYRAYSALFSQIGTSAPNVNLFENSLNISESWVRLSAGNYKLDTTIPYDVNKIYIPGFGLRQPIIFSDGIGITTGQGILYFLDNVGTITFYFQVTSNGNLVDLSSISPTPIVHLPEIRVYN